MRSASGYGWTLRTAILKKKVAAYTVDVKASVRKMGGNPTPEELLDAADQIRRGAELARNLQEMDLAYTEEA